MIQVRMHNQSMEKHLQPLKKQAQINGMDCIIKQKHTRQKCRFKSCIKYDMGKSMGCDAKMDEK